MSGHLTSTPGAKAENHFATAWITSPQFEPFYPTLCCVSYGRSSMPGLSLSLMRGWEESGCRHVTAGWHDPCIGRHALKDLGHFGLRHLAVGM